MHLYLHTYYIHTNACTHVYVHTCKCTYAHTCTCTYVHVHVHFQIFDPPLKELNPTSNNNEMNKFSSFFKQGSDRVNIFVHPSHILLLILFIIIFTHSINHLFIHCIIYLSNPLSIYPIYHLFIHSIHDLYISIAYTSIILCPFFHSYSCSLNLNTSVLIQNIFSMVILHHINLPKGR